MFHLFGYRIAFFTLSIFQQPPNDMRFFRQKVRLPKKITVKQITLPVKRGLK